MAVGRDGRAEQRLLVLEVPIDAELGYPRSLGDLVQCRRLKTQFHKEFARGVDYARCPLRGLIAGPYFAPGPALPPPPTPRTPSLWMTSSSSAAALPVSPPPCGSAVPAARSPFSIPACRATASLATRMACSV